MLIAFPALLGASALSLVGHRSGSYLAMAGGLLGFISTSSQVCAFAFFLYIPLLGTGGYFSVLLPFLLFVATIAFSLLALRIDEPLAAPLTIVAQKSWRGYLMLGYVGITCLSAILFGATEIALRGAVVETHKMTWQANTTSQCSAYLELGFTGAPGYAISTCSPELRDYLATEGSEVVEVRLERNYEWGAWHYQLKSVSGWKGSAELSGLSWSCRSQSGDCPRSGGPPLRQPYILD